MAYKGISDLINSVKNDGTELASVPSTSYKPAVSISKKRKTPDAPETTNKKPKKSPTPGKAPAPTPAPAAAPARTTAVTAKNTSGTKPPPPKDSFRGIMQRAEANMIKAREAAAAKKLAMPTKKSALEQKKSMKDKSSKRDVALGRFRQLKGDPKARPQDEEPPRKRSPKTKVLSQEQLLQRALERSGYTGTARPTKTQGSSIKDSSAASKTFHTNIGSLTARRPLLQSTSTSTSQAMAGSSSLTSQINLHAKPSIQRGAVSQQSPETDEEDSFESSDEELDNGFDALMDEEETSLRAARKEDQQALREENEHRREKMERKQKLQQLADAKKRR